MRIPFVVAFSDGMIQQIVNAIPAMTYVPEDEMDGIGYKSAILDVGGVEYHFLVHLIVTNVALPWLSAATNGKWSIVYFLPADSVNYVRGCRLYNAMRRKILSASNRNVDGDWYMQGPWSIPKIRSEYPAFAAQYFETRDEDGIPTGIPNVPIMISGDTDPLAVAQVDYSPLDIDCANDVIPDEGSLY